MILRPGIVAAKPAGGSSYTGPLDIVPGAVVAFGQRALSAALRGSALYTIANGRGGATQSFNSDVTTGDAPVSAIEAYSATPFGRLWNDQSGNGSDAIATLTSNQPGWTPNLSGGRPGFDGFLASGNGSLTTAGNVTFTGGGITVFAVATWDVSVSSNVLWGQGFETLAGGTHCTLQTNPGQEGTSIDMLDASGATELFINADALPPNAIVLFEATSNNVDTSHTLINGSEISQVGDVFGFTGIAYPLSVLNDDANGNNVGEKLLELIIYNSMLSAPTRLAIRQNIAAYYGIMLP